MSERARIGRTLLAAMREDAAAARASLAGADPGRLAAAARYHGAAGHLHAGLRDEAGDTDAAEAVATVYHFGLGLAMRALADLGAVAPILDEAGLEWLIVKGPALAERLYPDPTLRAYDDLDLVVRPGQFGRAVEVLEGAGAPVIDRNWRLLGREMRGQVHLNMRHGTLLDLHWNLVNRDRRQFAIPMGEIIDRARAVEVGGYPVRTLDAVDTLLHVCLHAYLTGGDRLIWLKDVERVVTVDAPDWDEVVHRSRSWRIGLPVAAMLARAARMLSAGVPAGVPDALGCSVRRRLDGTAARVLHPERSRTARSASAMAARVLARSPSASSAVYARRLLTRATRRRPRGIDPILAPHGDATDRRDFLDRVAGGRREPTER